MREKLAELCHKQWSGWMEYLFSKCEVENISDIYGSVIKQNIIMPAWGVKRWKKQMNTPYQKLSEEEKESDRKEADRFLDLLT
ncbi:hypothetical protein KA005_54180 [bacterium]|nr:hypothetical protein [bacterium]